MILYINDFVIFTVFLLHIIILNPNFFLFQRTSSQQHILKLVIQHTRLKDTQSKKSPEKQQNWFVTKTLILQLNITNTQCWKIDLYQKQTLIFQKPPKTDVTAYVKQPIFPIPASIVVKIILSIVSIVCFLSPKTDVTYWVHLLIVDTVNGTI